MESVSFINIIPGIKRGLPKAVSGGANQRDWNQAVHQKGRHVGTGGRLVKLFVAISFQQGIVCCEQYEKLNGDYFKDFVLQHFPKLFNNCRKSHSRWFIQDGDPSQNSLKARKAMELVGAKLLAIPPRSPDLNPIENVFHLIKKRVDRDALDKHITFESFEEFSKRVKSTFNYMSKDVIDNIIGSMCTRIDMVLKNKDVELGFDSLQ